jgi:membrane associated rhomboid family serine protease
MEKIMFNGVPADYILNRWFALNPILVSEPIAHHFNFQMWQLITYQFMHGNFSHILFNMFGLWMFGAEIENIFGSKKFLIFYLLAGVTAGILHLFVSPLLGASPAVTIGASGSVFGVLVAFALLFPDRYIFLYFLIPVKAKYLIGFLIVVEFLAINSAHSNVAHLAHLGGALFGFIYLLLDKNFDLQFKNLFRREYFYRKKSRKFDDYYTPSSTFKRNDDLEEVNYRDIDNDEIITQAEIDEILDKIGKSGYQSLTEREKRILFEASKKMK